MVLHIIYSTTRIPFFLNTVSQWICFWQNETV